MGILYLDACIIRLENASPSTISGCRTAETRQRSSPQFALRIHTTLQVPQTHAQLGLTGVGDARNEICRAKLRLLDCTSQNHVELVLTRCWSYLFAVKIWWRTLHETFFLFQD